MCYYWYDACINATIGSDGTGNAAQQFQCTEARNTNCGSLTAGESSSGSSPSQSQSSQSSIPPAASIRPVASLATGLLSTAATLATSSTSSSASSPASNSPSPGTSSSPSGQSSSSSSGISPGAIAGIVIGVVLGIAAGIAILWFCRRSRRSVATKTPGHAHPDFHEKHVVTTSISGFPSKPELQGDHYVPELEGSQRAQLSELHNTTPTVPAWRDESQENQPRIATGAPLHGTAIQSDVNTAHKRGAGNRSFTQDSIAALEEEERRIDADMAEVRRMQKLRDQKYAVQQKLKAAKSAGPFEM
jgi:hypothetical protein